MKIMNVLKFHVAALMIAAFIAAPQAKADTRIEFEVYKVGLIVGVGGGKGTLYHDGQAYPLSVGGVSLGATIGASKAEMIGTVKNLTNVRDIEGVYSAAGAGLAVAAGATAAQLKNSKGVELSVSGRQIGLELSIDLSGLQISLK